MRLPPRQIPSHPRRASIHPFPRDRAAPAAYLQRGASVPGARARLARLLAPAPRVPRRARPAARRPLDARHMLRLVFSANFFSVASLLSGLFGCWPLVKVRRKEEVVQVVLELFSVAFVVCGLFAELVAGR